MWRNCVDDLDRRFDVLKQRLCDLNDDVSATFKWLLTRRRGDVAVSSLSESFWRHFSTSIWRNCVDDLDRRIDVSKQRLCDLNDDVSATFKWPLIRRQEDVVVSSLSESFWRYFSTSMWRNCVDDLDRPIDVLKQRLCDLNVDVSATSKWRLIITSIKRHFSTSIWRFLIAS